LPGLIVEALPEYPRAPDQLSRLRQLGRGSRAIRTTKTAAEPERLRLARSRNLLLGRQSRAGAQLGTRTGGAEQPAGQDPDVIGAFIYPGLCLNLTDYGVKSELLDAYSTLSKTLEQTGTPPPKNSTLDNGIFLRRTLDCAVIKTVHALRASAGEDPYQTVYGVFEEGAPLYPNAGFKAKTHVQLAVIDPDCILGYFRVSSRRRNQHARHK
jgi:hypothetical protein